MVDRQIRQNATMVAEGLASDWRNAYIIACSVRLGAGEGGGGTDGSHRANSRSEHGKVSANEFARLIAERSDGKVYGRLLAEAMD